MTSRVSRARTTSNLALSATLSKRDTIAGTPAASTSRPGSVRIRLCSRSKAQRTSYTFAPLAA
jgi:hypothetical protein